MSQKAADPDEVEKEDGLFRLRWGEDVAVEILAFTDGEEHHAEEFSLLPVETDLCSESTWSKIRDADGLTLGCVFPAMALAHDSALASENCFVRAFAVNAVLHTLTTRDLREQFFDINNVDPSGQVTIVDVLGMTRGVAILDQGQLRKADLSSADVEASLRLFGFRRLTPPRSIKALREDYNNVTVSQLTPSLGPYSSDYLNAIEEAHRASTNVARFMLLYQAIEILIAIIFDYEVRRELRDKEDHFDSWALRDKLADLSRERHRIGYIASRYCAQSKISTELDDLRLACKGYLELHNLDDIPDDWSKALYKVRNLVVHRQFRTIRQDEPLQDVCVCLSRLVIKLGVEFHIDTEE